MTCGLEGIELKRSQVNRLVGMRDLTGDAHARSRQAAEDFREYMGSKGYSSIDTPLLEETELFVRKSGGELTSRLYSFVDPGGHRVSMRPEFTSSVIRCFVQDGDWLTLPVRWQYGGPVFRYERTAGDGYRQYTQLGAELIGADGAEADVEVLALAWESLQSMGLQDLTLRIGHLGVFQDLLTSCGLSERAKLFAISNIQDLKSGTSDPKGLVEQASDLGLLKNGGDDGAPTAEYIQSVLSQAKSSPTGRRTTDQIVERLLRKTREADSSHALKGALELVGELARVEGSQESALGAARDIAGKRELHTSALDRLSEVVSGLITRGVDSTSIMLDLGLARGFGYYTGIIFEIVTSSRSGPVVLGGGGRYDGLVKALGGDSVPALGFAVSLESVTDSLQNEDKRASGASAAPSKLEGNRAATRNT